MLVGLVASAIPAEASHLRAGGLNWHATPVANVAEFHYTGAFRWTFFGRPAVGSTIQPFGINFGDSTGASPNATVTSVDSANDVFTVDSHFTHAYSSMAPRTAFVQVCCRASRTPTNHINNPDGEFRVETLVNLAASRGSAASQTSPIVDCPISGLCQFGLPATSPDTGASLRYRFATNAEAAGGRGFVQPAGAAINSTTGVYSWNTTGAVSGGLYSTQVMIETHLGGGVVTKTPVDFFIRISSTASPNQAPAFTGSTPADGTVINVPVGQTATIPVQATDPNAGDTVTLGAILPAGATFTKVAGNPASGTISFTPTAVGDSLFTLTAADQLGLQATQRSVRVRAGDNVPPVMSGPGDTTAEATGPSGAAVSFSASASDAIDGPVAVTCTPASGSTFALGATPVSCTATDSSGNTSSSAGTVTVVDTTGPDISVNDVTAEAVDATGATVTFSAAATDLVDGATPVLCTPASGSQFPLGTTPVSCESTDSHGNPSLAGFSVLVQDTTDPVLVLPADITEEATGPAGADISWSASASDAVSGGLTPTCTPASGSTFALGGPHAVHCSAADAAGNTADGGFSVSVVDTTAPAVIYTGPSTLEATGPDGAEAVLTGSATDLIDGPLPAACNSVDGATLALGPHEIVCTATDAAGNATTGSFTVTVQDTLGPVITTSGDQTIEATSPAGATATYLASAVDAVDGAVPVSCSPASGSTFPLGTTVALCEASDSRGNSGVAATAAVTVVDTTDPTLSVPADVVAEATGPDGAVVSYPAATATDLVDTDVVPECSPASGSQFGLGSHSVTCTATDDAGNSTEASFTVTVQDTTAPVVTPPAPVTTEATGPDGAVVSYDDATATDLVSGTVAVSCEPPSGSTLAIGSSAVLCTAVDAAGNEGTASTSMTVVDTTAPDVVAPEDMTLEAASPDGAVASWPEVVAEDQVDGAIVAGCIPPSGSTFALGAAGVECSATDAAGNRGQDAFTVTVVDTTPPAISVPTPADTEVTGPNGAAVTFDAATASDIVDGSVPTSCNAASDDTFPLGTTTVTCTAADVRGNTATASFEVYVVDTTPPVVKWSGNAGTYTVDQTVLMSCTASDSASGVASTTCADVNGPAYSLGLGDHTVSATATDNAGNVGEGSTTFTVTVDGESLRAVTRLWVSKAGVAHSLCTKIAQAESLSERGKTGAAAELENYRNQVAAQSGKSLTPAQAEMLRVFSLQLAAQL